MLVLGLRAFVWRSGLVAAAIAAAIAAVIAAAALAGPVAAAERAVEMSAGAFVPASIEISVGDRIKWTNRDDALHDATGSGWATPLLARDQSATVTFTAAGRYAYVCTIHPDMTGTIVVRAAKTGSGSGGARPTDPPTDALPAWQSEPGSALQSSPGSASPTESGSAPLPAWAVLSLAAAAGAALGWRVASKPRAP